MYAASYQRRRHTSVIIAGGPESAIFKTTDGGSACLARLRAILAHVLGGQLHALTDDR